MRVLVTGINGFVGARLARHLRERRDWVSGTYFDVRPDLEGVTLYEANLLDREALQQAIEAAQPDAIVHLAGLSHVGDSWNWELVPSYFWVNVVGTENVLAASNGRRVVIASSADVYGLVPEEEQPISEDRRISPQSPYALSKAASERLALMYDGAVIVRSFNLVGPGQAPRFSLPSWAAQLAAIRRNERESVLEVGNLTTKRDFVHVDDGAAAYRLLAEDGDPGMVYNLASGKAVPMRAALARLLAISGVEAKVRENCFPSRPHDIPCLSGDAGRLRALGWQPRRSLDDALSDLWAEANFGF